MRGADLTSEEAAKLPSPQDLMEREWAPCRHNCPVHADVRAYIELAARGQWQAAIDVIRERLPFASVCGRICHHPCEANCRRKGVDEAVAIREVKRFVTETQGAAGATVRKAAQTKAKVAIVGAGPAGLAAALELAKMGYRPTVLEKSPVAGGIPATAIPTYRLPRKVLQQDIDWICAHGVTVQTGVEVGKDKTIDALLKEGFAAVLVATGLARSRMLPMPGADHKMVYPVLDFLQKAAFAQPVTVGKDVLVIGGGNVAMDAARTAARMGAARVRAVCLENEQEMPAWSWEQEEAREEGVSFIHRRGPVEVVVKDGQIAGLKTRKVTRVFDEGRRFSPQYDDADVNVIQCATIIVALGQMADMGFTQSGRWPTWASRRAAR
ncbi:MAG: FAD-dependent oxidoreductase [Planctomycetota bacterium]|nr:FAD-dependent oxidoreductase [Planctomycetota bacterium]